MRLIDADALKKVFEDMANDGWNKKTRTSWDRAYEESADIVDEQMTIEERKRGRWIHGREIGREMVGDCITAIFYEDWKCSACGCTVEEERQPLWNFCPSCGADMRGEEE